MVDYFPSSRRYAQSLHPVISILIACLQIVELLFARGLVKVLFATETFAMVREFPPRYDTIADDLSDRVSTCLPSASSSPELESTMDELSEISCLVNSE